MLCLGRAQSLQSAKAAYEDFHHGRDHVLQFLASIPSYEPQETDSLSQMETKLKNQKVRWPLLQPQAHTGKGGSEVSKPLSGETSFWEVQQGTGLPQLCPPWASALRLPTPNPLTTRSECVAHLSQLSALHRAWCRVGAWRGLPI